MSQPIHDDASRPLPNDALELTRPPRLESFPEHVHLLGAGGAGVSGLGRILIARGVRVSGHDRSPSRALEGLAEAGAEVLIGESEAAWLPGEARLVVRSAAVSEEDPQVRAARARGLPVWKYAEALRLVSAPERLLAVAGTHGKTGSSWMLWNALDGLAPELGAPIPGALIGGTSRRLRTSALAGTPGAWFCVEACEYDRSFLQLAPRGAIVTNVDHDHLDYYGSYGAIKEAFARFASRLPGDGLLVLGRDVPREVEHAARATVWRLGHEFDLQLLGESRGHFAIRVHGPGWATPRIELAVPGEFNAENAACALALAIGIQQRALRVDPARVAGPAAAGVERFGGVARRFEPWGDESGVAVVHDYAHHPTEVNVTLEAARRVYPGLPLFVLFQPHQHSRTARFLDEFAEALRQADGVVVADVYGARAHIDGDRRAGAAELVTALRQRGVAAQEGGLPSEATRCFVEMLPAAAAAFVLGAGDIDGIREDLLGRLAGRPTLAARI